MAESAMDGLFQTPEMYQQARLQQQQAQAAQYAQMDPMQRAAYGTYMAGQQLGSSIGQLFGVEDPQLKMISQRNALARQIDPNNPQSYIDVAKMAAQSGDPQFAMSLAAVGQDAIGRQAQMRQNLATAQKTESALLQEKQLRDELAKLGPNPASDEVISVVAKFGSPDKLLSVVQTSMDRAEARRQQADQAELNRRAALERQQEANRAAYERQQEALAARLQLAQQQGATTAQLAQMRIDAHQENISLRQQLKADEKAANVARGMDALNSELDNLTTAYSTLNDLRAIPSTERGAMSNILSSISASGAGQVVGRTLGTVEQTERDVIGGSRMRLLNSIKEATGMSAQQLNSNVELSTWLKAVSDPSQSIQAVTKNLDNIRTWVNKRSGGTSVSSSETAGQWGKVEKVKKWLLTR